MDLFAAEIGMDPAAVRRKNFIQPDQFPYSSPSGLGSNKSGIDLKIDSGNYVPALDKALTMANYYQLDAERARSLFARLREVADIVVVDSAPATEVSDALLLASAADITLIAVRLRHTRRRQFDALRDSLAQYGISVSGLVVTTRDAPTNVVRGSTMPVPLESKAPRRLRRDSAAQAEGHKTSKS